MEPIVKTPGTIKGIEVLFFDEAEISKIKGNETSYATFGPLSVLYFKDYDRFVLQINDWRYPLIRRLGIDSSSGIDAAGSRTYTFPAPNGFSFKLKISKTANNNALTNLDTILENNSRFSLKGKAGLRKLEPSPDDHVVRRLSQDTGPKEVITETVKQVVEKIENKIETVKTETPNLTSTKEKMNLSDIKNKDFDKEAQSTIKKEELESIERLSSDFLQKRTNNPNITNIRDFSDLRKTSDSEAPVLYLPQEDLESCILINKEMATSTVGEVEKKGFVANVKEALNTAKETMTGLLSGQRSANKDVPATTETKTTVAGEGMTHYSG